MKIGDMIAGSVLLVGSISLSFYAGTFPVRKGVSPVLSAGFYPRLLAFILGGLSILLIITSVVKKTAATEDKQPFWKTRESFFLFLLTLGALVLYPFMLNVFGLAVTGFAFILLLVSSLSEKGSRRPFVILSVSLGITALTVLVFQVFLRIPFPSGLIFQ
ncbi:MAG: tripartite tricarboxylate transporter TctB family protein [bacterium]|nr:tripartite tricarboxylate transporter TctB family protein [bacterium]